MSNTAIELFQGRIYSNLFVVSSANLYRLMFRPNPHLVHTFHRLRTLSVPRLASSSYRLGYTISFLPRQIRQAIEMWSKSDIIALLQLLMMVTVATMNGVWIMITRRGKLPATCLVPDLLVNLLVNLRRELQDRR
jgi:hypothetical protein